MGKTTVKAIELAYGDVGASGFTTTHKVMGVLKGLAIGQDEPASTEIEAEFYDTPFDIIYDGNPVTMTFELANYELTDLETLFGGEYSSSTNTYEGAVNAHTTEHAWRLKFGRGMSALYIYKGLTVGTIKKDADGALNYSVTITALIWNDGTDDHMYRIEGSGAAQFEEVVEPTGNPKNNDYFERDGSTNNYRKTWDTTPVAGKTYYTLVSE